MHRLSRRSLAGRSLVGQALLSLALLLFLQGGISLAQQAPNSAPQSPVNSSSSPNSIHIERSHEDDLNTLSLQGSKLGDPSPIIGETDQYPTFSRQMIQVHWRSGDPIDLYVIRPKGAEKPAAVLYLYSYPSETDRFKDEAYCRRITSGGVAAIGFVSALTGPRYHDRPMREWFVSEFRESLVDSVHDVQMILNYLGSRGDIDMDHIGMFGAGSGGTIAILAASVDSRIKAIDLLDPWGDWPDWMKLSPVIPENERPNYIKPQFLKNIAALDPVRVLPKLKPLHVRMQQVADDADTPEICQKRLLVVANKAGQSVKAIRYEDRSQFFGAVAAGRLFDWIKLQVRPAAQQQKIGGAQS
jgi:hypothetical protein